MDTLKLLQSQCSQLLLEVHFRSFTIVVDLLWLVTLVFKFVLWGDLFENGFYLILVGIDMFSLEYHGLIDILFVNFLLACDFGSLERLQLFWWNLRVSMLQFIAGSVDVSVAKNIGLQFHGGTDFDFILIVWVRWLNDHSSLFDQVVKQLFLSNRILIMGRLCHLPLLLCILRLLNLLLIRKLLVDLRHWEAIDNCAVISLAESCFTPNILLSLRHAGDKAPLREASTSRVFKMLHIPISHIRTVSSLLICNDGSHLSCTFPIYITSKHGGLLRLILANIRLFGHGFELVVLVK